MAAVLQSFRKFLRHAARRSSKFSKIEEVKKCLKLCSVLVSLSTQPDPFCNVAMECTKPFPADLGTKRLSYSYQGPDATGMLSMLNNPYHDIP
jgi:hypothetical protein